MQPPVAKRRRTATSNMGPPPSHAESSTSRQIQFFLPAPRSSRMPPGLPTLDSLRMGSPQVNLPYSHFPSLILTQGFLHRPLRLTRPSLLNRQSHRVTKLGTLCQTILGHNPPGHKMLSPQTLPHKMLSPNPLTPPTLSRCNTPFLYTQCFLHT